MILLFIFFFTLSCSVKNHVAKYSFYDLKKYKSKQNNTKIIIKTYDGDLYNEKITPYISMNNIYFFKDSLFNVGVGKHDIEIGYISKESIKIKNLEIKKGDSLVIEAFLKRHNQPIID